MLTWSSSEAVNNDLALVVKTGPNVSTVTDNKTQASFSSLERGLFNKRTRASEKEGAKEKKVSKDNGVLVRKKESVFRDRSCVLQSE